MRSFALINATTCRGQFFGMIRCSLESSNLILPKSFGNTTLPFRTRRVSNYLKFNRLMKSRRGEKCTVITRNDLEGSKYEPSPEINKLYHKWNVYNKINIVSSFVTCFSCVLYTVFFPHARRITINNEKFQIRLNKLTMRLRPRLVWRFQTFVKICRAKKDEWKYRDLNH